MTTAQRQTYKRRSNNPANPNQNWCAMKVCETLGVADAVRYLHVINDTLRAARTRYSVRSRLSKLGKRRSVGAARALCAKVSQEEGALAFIVWVDGHVILLNPEGLTAVDSDPRKRDRRNVQGIWAVFAK